MVPPGYLYCSRSRSGGPVAPAETLAWTLACLGVNPCPRWATTWRFGRDPDLVYDTPRVRAVSRVRWWRIIQAAERARQAIAHGATGCAVVSGVIAASSASKAVSQMANSMIWLRKPRRWRAVRP